MTSATSWPYLRVAGTLNGSGSKPQQISVDGAFKVDEEAFGLDGLELLSGRKQIRSRDPPRLGLGQPAAHPLYRPKVAQSHSHVAVSVLVPAGGQLANPCTAG